MLPCPPPGRAQAVNLGFRVDSTPPIRFSETDWLFCLGCRPTGHLPVVSEKRSLMGPELVRLHAGGPDGDHIRHGKTKWFAPVILGRCDPSNRPNASDLPNR